MKPTEKAIRDFCGHHANWWPSTTQVQEMLALAQPEQEPVAWVCHGADGKHDIDFYQDEIDAIPVTTMLYTTPPQRKPLGEHEITKILDRERMKWHKSPPTYEFDLAFARAIEVAHGIKE